MFIEQVSGQNIKIKFDINEKQLLLGDILKITASGKNGVLAQVKWISNAEKNPNFNIAESKILFTIDSSGKLINWQGNIPSQDFIINKLSAKEVLLCSNTLNSQNPIPVGVLSLYPETEVNLEASFFEKPTVIYCDKQTQKDNILNLLSCELSKTLGNTVLVDFNNNFSDLKISSILEAGKHIKLPFDLKGLELLYNKSLSDVSLETRATVEDIFIEIENYLSSGEVEYIPFSSFRQAVDSVYETNKIPELVLLKNKLLKLQKQGVFADKKQEITSLVEKTRINNLVIVDLSKFPTNWQKDLIEFIIDSNTKKYRQKFFLLVDADKINTDKVFIENLCGKANKNGVYPIIITGHESESAVSLTSYAANIIAFAPENTTKITALKDHLIRLQDNKAVITGKITNNIPLYVNIYDLEDLEESYSPEDSKQTSPEIYLFPEGETQEESENAYDEDEENFDYSKQFAHDKAGIELIENISKLQEEVYVSQKETLSLDEDADFDLEQDEIYNINSKNAPFYDEDEEIYNISEDAEELNEESDDSELEQDKNYDISEEPEEQINSYNAAPKKTSFSDAVEIENNYSSSKKYASGFSEDDLSSFLDDTDEDKQPSSLADEDFDYNSNEEFKDDSVLDYGNFYDDSEEEQNNDDVDEEPEKPSVKTKSAGPPMPDIPIYSTPKKQSKVLSDADFQEGDKVSHEKYGLGVVTKIIGSNEKRLCSIQFDDVGRRLLDPNLSELKKI